MSASMSCLVHTQLSSCCACAHLAEGTARGPRVTGAAGAWQARCPACAGAEQPTSALLEVCPTCFWFLVGQSRSWPALSGEDLFDEALEIMARRNEPAQELYLRRHPSFDYDVELGRFRLLDAHGFPAWVFPLQQVGSFNEETGSWLWAWASPHLPDAQRWRAAEIGGQLDRLGVRFSPESQADIEVAWGYAAAGAWLLGGQVLYRVPQGALHVFFSLGAPQRGPANTGVVS